MSQTLTKRIQITIRPENLIRAFALMDLTVEQNASLRLYHTSQQVVLKIPSETLERIGFPPTVFSDGVGLDFQDGQIQFVYDHYNQATLDALAEYIEALNAIGSQAENLQALSAQGYTFEPVFDLTKQEIGVRAIPPDWQSPSNAWDDSNTGGRLW